MPTAVGFPPEVRLAVRSRTRPVQVACILTGPMTPSLFLLEEESDDRGRQAVERVVRSHRRRRRRHGHVHRVDGRAARPSGGRTGTRTGGRSGDRVLRPDQVLSARLPRCRLRATGGRSHPAVGRVREGDRNQRAGALRLHEHRKIRGDPGPCRHLRRTQHGRDDEARDAGRAGHYRPCDGEIPFAAGGSGRPGPSRWPGQSPCRHRCTSGRTRLDQHRHPRGHRRRGHRTGRIAAPDLQQCRDFPHRISGDHGRARDQRHPRAVAGEHPAGADHQRPAPRREVLPPADRPAAPVHLGRPAGHRLSRHRHLPAPDRRRPDRRGEDRLLQSAGHAGRPQRNHQHRQHQRFRRAVHAKYRGVGGHPGDGRRPVRLRPGGRRQLRARCRPGIRQCLPRSGVARHRVQVRAMGGPRAVRARIARRHRLRHRPILASPLAASTSVVLEGELS